MFNSLFMFYLISLAMFIWISRDSKLEYLAQLYYIQVKGAK